MTIDLSKITLSGTAFTCVCFIYSPVSVLPVSVITAQSDSEKNKSWGEMVEDEEQEVRTPGKAVHMHEKLSSPSRKR